MQLPVVRDEEARFTFDPALEKGSVSDLPVSRHGKDHERNIAREIFGNPEDRQKKIIDHHERNMGFGPKPKPRKSINKALTLDMSVNADKERLDKLMNSPDYQITMWKDTWTVRGDFRVFIIYEKIFAETKEEPETI